MDKNELRKMYKSLGFSEEKIDEYISLEERFGYAYFAAARFIRPLVKEQRYYKNCEWADWQRERINEGKMDDSFEDNFIMELYNKGIDLNKVSRYLAKTIAITYNDVLYRLSEAGGDDYDLPNSGMDLPDWTLRERTSMGEETGRYLPELHNLIEW